MTPADHLTQAAAHLRKLAAEASPGPWLGVPGWIDRDGGKYDGVQTEGACVLSQGGCDVVGEWGTDTADALYIAAMSPPVALALADWLESLVPYHVDCDRTCPDIEPALAFAALIVPAAAEVEA